MSAATRPRSSPSSTRSARSTSSHDEREPPRRPPGAAHRDLSRASTFYTQLCGWRPEQIETRSGSYHALALGGDFGGGIVECGTRRALWLPYVEVDQIQAATDQARTLGA